MLGNHDRSRIASRIGREQARLALMLLLTLRGTPTCYYGDELEMQDVQVPPELMADPQGKDNPEHSRDPERSPMQWDSSPNGGFCAPDVTPWLPLATDYQQYNVAVEQDDPRSMLTLTQRLLAIRRAQSALNIGAYQSIEQDNPTCFVYQRQHEQQRYLIALNFSDQEQQLHLQEKQGQLVLSTYLDREESIELDTLLLRPNEGMLIQVL